MNKKRFSEVFTWNEFYDRYVNNHEEFTFIYNDLIINLITDGTKFLYTIGTPENGFTTSILYNSPLDLLNNALFNGNKLNDIWDDLK